MRPSSPRLMAVITVVLGLYTLCGLLVWGLAWRAGDGESSSFEALQHDVPGSPDSQEDAPVRLLVRSIFGDPVPGAYIRLDDAVFVTDVNGESRLTGVAPGVYEVVIEADGFLPLPTLLRIDAPSGEHAVPLDDALWPQGFAVDFHVFHSDRPDTTQRVFLLIQLANGTEHPVYLRDIGIYGDDGTPLVLGLEGPEAYERIAFANPGLRLVTGPHALVLQPFRTAIIEWAVPSAVPAHLGPLRLRIRSGDAEQHAHQAYDVYEFLAVPIREDDYDPHRP